jgi:hypothetical protein
MPTNIYLTVLSSDNAPCTLLTPVSDYQTSGDALGKGEYSVIETKVASQLLSGTTTEDFNHLDDGTYFSSIGTQIMSVSRDIGIKTGKEYYLNIPLQFSGDTTIVIVQLKLKGTSTDSEGYYGSQCEPASYPGGQQLPVWNSAWLEMLDTSGATSTATTAGDPEWSWYAQDGTLYTIYLCDWPGYGTQMENDDLFIMICDASNYPTHGGAQLPPC